MKNRNNRKPKANHPWRRGMGHMMSAGTHMRKVISSGPEYTIWARMIQVCNNKNNPKYRIYGGRGITVCPAWRSFACFFDYVGPRPSPHHSIDRYPNKDGNYEPGNVRWATATEQASANYSNPKAEA